MSDNLQALLAILSDDPSGTIWLVAALNLLTIATGFKPGIANTKTYKALVFAQLLVIPRCAAIGFHYAIRPVA